jgi:hypothetical protein
VATFDLLSFWVAQQIAILPAQGKGGSSSGRQSTTIVQSAYIEEETTTFNDASNGVSAFPNPVRDHVILQIDGLTTAPSGNDVYILDHTGRTYSARTEWFGEKDQLAIDFSGMGTGIYFIRVNTQVGVKSVRVSKIDE